MGYRVTANAKHVGLCAENELLRSAARWIPVGERPPAEGQEVQVWRLWSNGHESTSEVVYRRGLYCDLSLAADGDFPARVTHWRALPSRPEGLPWEAESLPAQPQQTGDRPATSGDRTAEVAA